MLSDAAEVRLSVGQKATYRPLKPLLLAVLNVGREQ